MNAFARPTLHKFLSHYRQPPTSCRAKNRRSGCARHHIVFSAGLLDVAEEVCTSGSTTGDPPQLGHLRSVVGLVWRSVVLWMLLLALLTLATSVNAQSLSYNSGQNVAPGYEGWEKDPDGTKFFVFGYMNRNWEEEIDVPVGPDNGT